MEKANYDGRQGLSASRTVLVVDDEPGVVRFVSFVLRRRGYQVLEAAGTEEALALAEKHAGPVHLLLTDVVMPSLDGVSLWESFCLIRPESRILFMSGHPATRVPPRLTILSKPFSAPSLLDMVDKAIG